VRIKSGGEKGRQEVVRKINYFTHPRKYEYKAFSQELSLRSQVPSEAVFLPYLYEAFENF